MQITIDQNHENSRLDRFLREYFNAPQAIVAGVIRKGKVKLNGKKPKQDSRLNVGDIVKIYHQFEEKNDDDVKISQHELNEFKSWIIFENDDFFAINKPYGISSQGGIRARLSIDVYAKNYNNEARITHRLDRETSGIMIIAKNKASARNITGLFANGLVKKQYVALSKFNPKVAKQGTITTDIIKDIHAQKMLAVEGQGAITQYKIAKHNEEFALVDVFPKTGKMHQIRVHLASIGMPICGDEKYEGMQFQRMMLHASLIEFDGFKISCKESEDFDV